MSVAAVKPRARAERETRTASISVVVCAYTQERWDDLLAAVDSLAAQTVAPHEVIVVVDHEPALAGRAREKLTGVIVVENGEERGLSGARNTGLRAARGEVVAFLDDDAVAAPDWLERLERSYGPDVLGVGGSAEAAWPDERPRWFPPEFDWVVGCTYLGLPERTAAVRNLIGANMSVRREVLEAVGGFATDLGRVGALPVGCEETDLCIRAGARFAGKSFVYDPGACVSHRVTATRATLRYFASRCFAEGRSKALVARRSGAAAGLASERAYTSRTLPAGFSRGLRDAVLRRDPWGAARALAIVAGLLVTTAGYLVGMSRDR